MIQLRIQHLLIVTILALGCSNRLDVRNAAGTSKANASTDGGLPQTSLPIWKSTSRRIELSSFGFWNGSKGYAKDRADLTPEQLTALAALRTMDPPQGIGADATSYEVRVIDEDGSVTKYRAADGNIRDSDEATSAAALATIDIATLQPFLDTIRCLAAKDVHSIRRTTDAPIDPSKADVTTAVALPTDTGCINGVFVPYECSDAPFTLDVSTTTTYEIMSDRCIETLSLRVYASDRTTLLAESTPGTNGQCFALRHTFEPGRYVLVLSKTNAAGCATNGAAGDTNLRIQVVQ